MKRKCAVPVLLVAALLWFFPIVFDAGAFAAERLTQIADGVYAYVDTRNATPASSFGANAGVIIGKERIAVVDTLVSVKEARRFIRDIQILNARVIRYVVNTHSHLDHTFGNLEFKKIGAVIIAHENCKSNMEKNSGTAMRNARAYGLTDKELEGTEILYPMVTFSDRMEIDLGEQPVELIYPGHTHTDDSIMVYVPNQKVLFAGDILFTNYYPNMRDSDVDRWIKVLDYILTMDVEKIVPGHGPVSTKKDIQDMKDYLIAFDRKAKELCAQSNDLDYIV
ncbi:MAG TPA: MBL fold metallo-hydrolase, partial [Dissulfurispiraceae bacterium]